MSTHLVTGATGLIGAAITLELLAEPDAEVWCLVRSRGGGNPPNRLASALEAAAHVYRMDHLLAAGRTRCHALPGDLAQPLAIPVSMPAISHVWHAAATLRFEGTFAERTRRVNVTGTQHALTLAELLGAQFNHISTTSVAPVRSGRRRELPPDATSRVDNPYEKTKLEAERLALAADVPWRILRPVMVVGHSRTCAVTTFSGLYGFAVRLQRFQRRHGDEAIGRVLRLRGAATAAVHFSPIDQTARNAVRVGLDGPPGQIYHLTNTQTPTVDDLYGVTFEWLGLRPPQCVDASEPLDGLDLALNTTLTGYTEYFSRQDVFDYAHTAAVVGADAMSAPMTRQTISHLLNWYDQIVSGRARAR